MILKKEISCERRTNDFFRNLEGIILWLLVFLSPTQLIKHFWPPWSLIFGVRVDYLSLHFSLSEVFVVSLFFLWCLRVFFFERKKAISFTLLFSNPWLLVSFFLFLVDVSFGDYRINSLFSWLKIFLLFWLFYYLSFLNKRKFSDWFFIPASFSLLFFGLIAILQFLRGSTLNSCFYWLGERSFNRETPGIALFSLAGRDFLRPYSTFSHPNSLAGFFGLFLILFVDFSPKNFFQGLFKAVVLFFGFFIFLLSFSRGSFLALFLCFLFFLLIKKIPAKKLYFWILSFVFLFSLFNFLISLDLESKFFLSNSIKERISLMKSARDVFLSYPLFGVGLNNFIIKTSYNFDIRNLNYQFQPVHTIYLLVLSELGVVGFLFFYLALLKVYRIASLLSKPWFFLALTFVIISGVVDHYWLTLIQNRLVLTFLLAGILQKGNGRGKNNS